jgi:C-terminal processing protease CtpA/Prc
VAGTRRFIGGLVLAGALAGFAAGGESATGRPAAADAERRRDWSRAGELYARLIADEGRSPELRASLARCLRRAEQARRLADPSYRRFAEALPLPQALAAYTEVLHRLQHLYWDRDRADPERLLAGGLDEIAALLDGKPEADALAGEIAAARAAAPDDLAAVRDAVKALAVNAKRLTGCPGGLLVMEAAAGACAGLDEYTLYLHPGRDDELAEVGVTLTRKDQQLVIDRVAPGSWAQAAGLRPGDRVARPADADDEIEVVSAGEAPRQVRLPGPPPAVAEADVADDPGRAGIGYLRITHFGRSLPLELDSALLRLRADGARAVVIDLRGNPGGVLAAAVHAAERFLPRGVVVTTRGQAGAVRVFSTPGPAAWDAPVVLLVDAGTASAAEVFAAALKDNGRAPVVGQATFGKAAVQHTVPLDAGGGVRLTLAKLFGPSGQSFHNTGIAPTVFEHDPGRQLDAAFEQAAKLLASR